MMRYKEESKTFDSEEPEPVTASGQSTTLVSRDKKRNHKSQMKMKKHLKKLKLFWPIKMAQLLCVLYILVLTFSKAPLGLVDSQTGNIIDPNSSENTTNGMIYINEDYRPVVAEGTWQKVCLCLSRMSAFSLYPMLILVFLTKCKALHSIFIKTPLSMFLHLHDSHELHAFVGNYIAVDVWIHTLFHILRWVDQGNLNLLWTHKTGLSGLVVVLAVPFIAFPMIIWKQKIRYEIRKGLHYLFFLFAVGMCFHVPVSAIPNGGFIAPIMCFCICLYAIDATFVYLFMTEKIETTTFHVLSSGIRITMDVSKRFQKRSEKGGYAYVCLPWVDQFQWHAFSLFEDPKEPSKRQVFIQKTGDWTKAVHRALQRDTVRPVWIQGPFISPYTKAETYDNQILIASGIGITPALSVIRAHKSSRRINLIWAVRDPAMLEFFLEYMYLDHDGWNLIFYTGKEPLLPALEELNTNVRVVKGRPNLKAVVLNIIYGIESGVGLPETYTQTEMVKMKGLLIDKMRELDQMGDKISSKEKVVALTGFANDRGFLFTEIINEMKGENERQRLTEAGLPKKHGCIGKDQEPSDKDFDKESTFSSDGNIEASMVLEQVREFGERGNESQNTCQLGKEDFDSSFRCELPAVSLAGHNSTKTSLVSPEKGCNVCESRGRCIGSSNCGGEQRMWKTFRQNFTPCMSARKVTKALTSTFRPWEENKGAEGYVKTMDKEHILPTWGMLYCGGSQPVQKALKKISADYHISLTIDSFSW